MKGLFHEGVVGLAEAVAAADHQRDRLGVGPGVGSAAAADALERRECSAAAAVVAG